MRTSRRGFIQGSAAGLLALGATDVFAAKPGVFPGRADTSKKIRLAAIGIGGKGYTDWRPMVNSGLAEIVAFCDADPKQLEMVKKRMAKEKVKFDVDKIPFYTDYRKMFKDQDKLQIEAITCSTPDHMHAAISITAMDLGIHCYVQKPLVRTLWEAQEFYKAAKRNGVVTQMGNQGSGGNGFRRNVEIVQSGILGDVTEVHVWTNRPVWPQGNGAALATKGGCAKTDKKGLDWDSWLGTAAVREFQGEYLPGKKGYDPWNLSANVYHPFSWRAFFAFGAGAFGDMACHTMNLPYRGLELGDVLDAKCTMIEEQTDEAYPMKSIVEVTYAERVSKVPGREGVKLPAVKLTWYDGREKPDAKLMPQVTAMKKYNGKVPETGCLIVGTKGILCSCADYGQEAFIALNGEKVAVDTNAHPECKKIAKRIPRCGEQASSAMEKSEGAAALSADGHYIEFLTAINGVGPVFPDVGSRCYSDVDYSCKMMEGILVGTVAQQVPGKLLKWNSAKQMFDNDVANKLVKPYIREGWEWWK